MNVNEFDAIVESSRSLPVRERHKLLNDLAKTVNRDERGNRIQFKLHMKNLAEVEADEMALEETISKAVGDEIAALRSKHQMSKNPLGEIGQSAGHIVPRSPLRNFKGTGAAEKAHRWGAWALAAITGSKRAKTWCDEAGVIVHKTGQLEGTNTLGGYLVPEILLNDVIDLRNEYGVFRRNAYHVTMTSDSTSRPRRTGGLTAYFVGEGSAGTASAKTWNNVTLSAKKLVVLSKMSSELSEDAVINLGDDLAGECVYAFSLKEDQCGFIGDATSTYGGITGVTTQLSNKWSTGTAGVGYGLVKQATGTTWGAIVLADLQNVVASTPTYARKGAKWFASPAFVDSVMVKLALAVGGATLNDVIRGDTPSFLGYPVERVEVLPATTASAQVSALFGDLSQAADFGDRRDATIMFSNSGDIDGTDVFKTDEIAIRATERFDVNVHDVGDGTTPGPVVGLITG